MAAQTPQTIGEAEARSHLQVKVDPIYPPIAKAAHIVGQAVLQIDIGTDGRVAGVKVVSAPAMLTGAATDAVREWVYAPFTVNGVPSDVQTS
jgi:protein TonB